jgi:mRNA interferase MazF
VTPVNLGNGTESFGSMIHPTVELLGTNVRVLVEQTTAVDPQRLGDLATRRAGGLSQEELMKINVALRAVFDLE